MVATHEAPRIAAFGFIDQWITAMLAHIVKRLDALILLTHHQYFFLSDRFHLPVARIGDLRFAPQ